MEKTVEVTNILTSFVQDLVRFVKMIGDFFDLYFGENADKALTEDDAE